MDLKELIRFDPKAAPDGRFVLGPQEDMMQASMRQSEVDDMLAELSTGGLKTAGIYDPKEAHILLAANVTPPIEQALTYYRWTDRFLSVQTYAPGDDNAIALENMTVMAWQTSAQGQALFTRPGYRFTRPELTQYDAGIELNWATMKRAGWNVLERAMRRAAGEIARKVDAQAKTVLDTAISGVSHNSSISGGALTKASVDTVIKSAADIGYPVTVAAINPGTLADMTGWTGGVFTSGIFNQEAVSQMLTTLYVANYGGVAWFTNSFVSTASVYFGGPGDQVGYEQRVGSMESYSDIDITNKLDKHVILSPEYAFYVSNAYRLWSITITA